MQTRVNESFAGAARISIAVERRGHKVEIIAIVRSIANQLLDGDKQTPPYFCDVVRCTQHPHVGEIVSPTRRWLASRKCTRLKCVLCGRRRRRRRGRVKDMLQCWRELPNKRSRRFVHVVYALCSACCAHVVRMVGFM